jgi:hypothetical protein
MQIKTYQYKLYRSNRNKKLEELIFLSSEIYTGDSVRPDCLAGIDDSKIPL